MSKPYIVLGDKTSHGGTVIAGSPTMSINGVPVARVGDKVTCPIPGHGTNPIISGDPDATVDGKPIARMGDKSACGAVLIASQALAFDSDASGGAASAGASSQPPSSQAKSSSQSGKAERSRSSSLMVASLAAQSPSLSDAQVDAKTSNAAEAQKLIESLKPGSKSDDVARLQTLLGMDASGTYGPKTQKAVKAFVLGDAFSSINDSLGTSINFNRLSDYEGFSLSGYVPEVTGGRSGVTVGVGFDVGQYSTDEIKAFGFSDDLVEKLLPYAELKLDAAREKLDELGGLELTIEEVKELTVVLKKEYASDVIEKFDSARKVGVASFTQLTEGQQTVVFSRLYHQGINFDQYANASPLWSAMTAGDWSAVQQELLNYPFANADWYKARVQQEAALLGD